MKKLSLLLGLFFVSGPARAEVFFESRSDLFKCPVSRSTEWVVVFGADELNFRGAIYERNTMTGDNKEIFAFANEAYFAKTVNGDYVFTGEGEHSVSIVFTQQFRSDKFTANIKFSGKNAPFEGTSRIEDCEKLAKY